jgi:hypothetical protein
MNRPSPLNLFVRGHIGQRATMGPRPIVMLEPPNRASWPPADYQHIDIELWGPNPSDGAVWRPTLGEVQQKRRPRRNPVALPTN